MQDEVVRLAVGLPVALLWPLGIPWLAESRWRSGAASALTAVVVAAPALAGLRAVLLVLLITAVSAALPRRAPVGDAGLESVGRIPAAMVAVLAAAAAAALIADAGATVDALDRAVANDSFVYALLGLLTAVFAAGAVIGVLLTSLAGRVEKTGRSAGVVNAGLYIGWLERALVFAFVVAGEPAAAALALTAKSVARFPAFAEDKEPLAEYVLIGTLLSFALALGAAMGTRGLLGEFVL
jgi:hypothetical protein